MSWAVPKGLPTSIGQKRLALQMSPHSLEYGKYEGPTPAKTSSGQGYVEIVDSGFFIEEEWSEAFIRVVLFGGEFSGTYMLSPSIEELLHWVLLKEA